MLLESCNVHLLYFLPRYWYAMFYAKCPIYYVQIHFHNLHRINTIGLSYLSPPSPSL